MKYISDQYEDGISKVTMKHKGKIFIGEAKLHPEDSDKASYLSGCSLAEVRATIKALKYERKLLKEEAEACRKFIKACSCHKDWDSNSPMAKIAYHQLNVKVKQVNRLTDEINSLLTFALYSKITREATLKYLYNKEKDKKD